MYVLPFVCFLPSVNTVKVKVLVCSLLPDFQGLEGGVGGIFVYQCSQSSAFMSQLNTLSHCLSSGDWRGSKVAVSDLAHLLSLQLRAVCSLPRLLGASSSPLLHSSLWAVLSGNYLVSSPNFYLPGTPSLLYVGVQKVGETFPETLPSSLNHEWELCRQLSHIEKEGKVILKESSMLLYV